MPCRLCEAIFQTEDVQIVEYGKTEQRQKQTGAESVQLVSERDRAGFLEENLPPLGTRPLVLVRGDVTDGERALL